MLANRCFLCGEGEETVDHLLLHCSKAKILWDLLLAIFRVSWVFPLFVKETLLSWHGSFVGKRRKKAWMAAPLCIFLTIWQERNRLAFEDVIISINRMKSTFLCNLWSSVNLHSVERPRSLVDFLTWMGCNGFPWFLLWVVGVLFSLLPFVGSPIVYLLYALGLPRWFNIICFYLSKKKKKIRFTFLIIVKIYVISLIKKIYVISYNS